MEYVKDRTGHIIGMLVERGNGFIDVRDGQNRPLGNYNANQDVTYDASGRIIGQGNQTMRLIG